MKHTKKNQEVFADVQLDSKTSYLPNGEINIIPRSWEHGREVTTTGACVTFRGSISVEEDGRTKVKRYVAGNQGPRYETIFQTAHADIKKTHGGKRESRGCVRMVFNFPRRYPLSLMKKLFKEEAEQLEAYLQSRKEETLWEK